MTSCILNAYLNTTKKLINVFLMMALLVGKKSFSFVDNDEGRESENYLSCFRGRWQGLRLSPSPNARLILSGRWFVWWTVSGDCVGWRHDG